MKLVLTSILLILLAGVQGFSQEKPAYAIFNSKGKKVDYHKMIRNFEKKDLVLFGELHNNAIAHWLQLEVTKSLNQTRQLTLGAEMFETDNQQALTDYISGIITAKRLDSLARLWPNYKTDYAPLVNFAKANGLKFIATNIPRKYASLVFKRDFQALDSLSLTEKSWIAPLPIEYDATLPGYAGMTAMMGGHGGETLPKAQAIKDATMAHFILKNYQPGQLFIHFHGAYHTDNYEGILWYLKRQMPNINAATITTVTQAQINKLEKTNLNKADFIICVDEDVTNTY